MPDFKHMMETYKKNDIIKEIEKCGFQCRVETNVCLSEHTSFKIGGKTDILFTPDSIDDIIRATTFCKEYHIPVFILGNGTNVLVSDSGYRGMVIKLGGQLNEMKTEGDKIITGAGASVEEVTRFALEQKLTGLEFAYGIPGSVGGAVFMNAGAYGFEMKNVVSRTVYLDEEGNIGIIDNKSHLFGYRTSCFQNSGQIILEVEFQLQHGVYEEIETKMKENMQKREKNQPLEMPSAGSVFRRPEGKFVGPMIEECGLKGYSIGGAQISEKHAGFIINRGMASADDVLNLIAYIKDEVLQKFNVELHPEIKFVGDYSKVLQESVTI